MNTKPSGPARRALTSQSTPPATASEQEETRNEFMRNVVRKRLQRADDLALKNIFIQLAMSILAIILVYVGVAMLRWGENKELVNERHIDCPPCQ